MEIITQVLSVIGIIAIIAVIAFVVIVAVFLKKLKKLLAGGGGSPTRIHLEEIASPQWQDKSKIQKLQKEITACGFTDLGGFKVIEMPTLTLNALVKGNAGQIAIIYEMAGIGIWIDIVGYFEDGSSITSTTNKIGQDLQENPKHKKIRDPEAGPQEILKMLKSESAENAPKPFNESKDVFVRMFEKAYADEMDWRNSLGGPSEEEIRAIARASGQNTNDETIAQTLLIQRMQACTGLVVAFAEKYREKHQLTEEGWQKIQHDLLFVHDKMPAEFLETVLSSAGIEDTTQTKELLKTLSPREAFRAILNSSSVSQGQKPEKIDELAEPLPTDVYKLARAVHDA